MLLAQRRGSQTARSSTPVWQVPTGCTFEMPWRRIGRFESTSVRDRRGRDELLSDIGRSRRIVRSAALAEHKNRSRDRTSPLIVGAALRCGGDRPAVDDQAAVLV